MGRRSVGAPFTPATSWRPVHVQARCNVRDRLDEAPRGRLHRDVKLVYVPLLKTQRELYELPRSRARFDAYLRAMTNPRTGDLQLPLSAMNPMAREHLPALLDALLASDADGAAARALTEEADRVRPTAGEFRVTLVVADDVRGQWTNRFTSEYGHRFEARTMMQRGWLVGLLWASEPASAAAAALEVRMQVHRAAYIARHGGAETLQQKMAQEGAVMVQAGVRSPRWSAAERTAVREVIDRHRNSTALPAVMTCLFGDVAAEALGYEPLGLCARAGLELALLEAE